MGIKNIVFDIGNVLVDFNFMDVFQKHAKEEETLNRMIQATVKGFAWDLFDKGDLSDEEIFQKFLEIDAGIEEPLRAVWNDLSGLIKKRAYTTPWIKELQGKGYSVYYLSNFPERTYLACLPEMDFLTEMDGGILSYQDKVIKPQPAIYELLLSRYELIAEECVFLDDVQKNVDAAKQLGMHTILFEHQETAIEKLKELGVF